MKHEEYDFEKACRLMARQAGWVALKIEKNGHKGVPDDLFISPDGSRCLLVEFKKDDKQQPRQEQRQWLSRFPALCHLIGNEDSFRQLLGL